MAKHNTHSFSAESMPASLPDDLHRFVNEDELSQGIYESLRRTMNEGRGEQKANKRGDWRRHTQQAKLEGYDGVAQKYLALLEADVYPPYEGLSGLDVLHESYVERGEEPAYTPEMMQRCAIGYVTKELGLSEPQATELMEITQGPMGQSDYALQAIELGQVGQAVKHIGIHQVEQLRAQCGIAHIHKLSARQRERMVRFIQGGTQEFMSGEVCVVIRDGGYDHNGAFSQVGSEFETPHTLLFEASDRRDDGRQLRAIIERIKESGVHPSTVVIAAHGAPGVMVLGETPIITPAREAESAERNITATKLRESGLVDLIANMQPDQAGNMHIVLKSCGQAGSVTPEQDARGEASTIVELANIVRSIPGRAGTLQLYGTEGDSNIGINNGALADTYRQQPLRRIIVTVSGNILESREPQEASVKIPMFGRE